MDLLIDIVALVAACTMLAPLLPLGAILPFSLSLRSVRIKRRGASVGLAGLDPLPMMWAGFVFSAVCVISLMQWGWMVALLTAVGALVLWFGFRVRVRVTPQQTRVVRSFAYVIPWSRRVHDEMPTAFVDGWGDFSDPEALHLGFGAGGASLELGWGDRSTADRCEALAAEFNDAVRSVREPGEGEGGA